MKISREINFQRLAVGYFEPPANPLCCQKCGAVVKQGRKVRSSPYFCRRHKFYVRKDGVCPSHSPEPYNPLPQQASLGELFDGDKDDAAST